MKITLTGLENLVENLKKYDAAKPVLLSKALRAGATRLKSAIKAEVASMTDGARTKKGAVVTKTVTGWRIHARGATGIGTDIPLFRQIHDEEHARRLKSGAVEAAFKSGDDAEIAKQMAKIKREMQSFKAKKLAGKAWRKFAKLRGDAMLEKGETGILYKSIDIKFLRPIRVAYHHETGEEMGRTGGPRSYSYGQNSWNLARWKTLNPGMKTAFVGPRHMVVVAYNPWTRSIERVDPARYAHLVEKGHLIKIRGKTYGKSRPRPFVLSTAARMRNAVTSAMMAVLKQELKNVLQAKDANVILDGLR
jgi:hypothetical protein